jgi:hypothetical protein
MGAPYIYDISRLRVKRLNSLATVRFSNMPMIDGSSSARNMVLGVC